MNIRLQKYKKNRLKGMNQYNAARAAKFSETYSRTHSDKLERAIKSDMADMLEQVGLTDSFMSKFMKKGLNAKKLCGKDAVKYADWSARHKFAETILKMAGKLKVADVEINTEVNMPNIQFIFTSEKVGGKGVRTTLTDGDLLAREGSDSNRIKEQI